MTRVLINADISSFFDANFYSRVYDVDKSEALTDFETTGERLGRVPNARFIPWVYRILNPDLPEAVAATEHYVAYGEAEPQRNFSIFPSQLDYFEYPRRLDSPNPFVRSGDCREIIYFHYREAINNQNLFDRDWSAKLIDLLFDSRFLNEYKNNHGDLSLSTINPLEHFYKHQYEKNRIKRSVIDLNGQRWGVRRDTNTPADCAAVLHAHYADTVDELVERALWMGPETSVYFGCTTKDAYESACEALSRLGQFSETYVELLPNTGRNFGSLFHFLHRIKNDFIVHLHGKKSLYTGEEQSEWRGHLFDCLVPSHEGFMTRLELLRRDEDTVVVSPAPFLGVEWAQSLLKNQAIIEMNGGFSWVQPHYYPEGGMFIARTSYLKELSARLEPIEWPREPIPADGTLAHAIERMVTDREFLDGRKALFAGPNSNRFWSDGRFIPKPTSLHLLIEQLSESLELITVDLFDTLIERVDIDPTMALVRTYCLHGFALSEAIDLVQMRAEAENGLRQDLGRFPSHIEIMQELKRLCPEKLSGLSASEMVDFEVRYELENTVEKELGRKILERAQMLGIPVMIITDTYYSRENIARIVDQHFSDYTFKEILVSSESGLRKDDGSIWRKLVGDIEQERHIHFGDNQVADCQIAGDHGFRTAWTPAIWDEVSVEPTFVPIPDLVRGRSENPSSYRASLGQYWRLRRTLFADDWIKSRSSDIDLTKSENPYRLATVFALLLASSAENIVRDRDVTAVYLARDGALPHRISQRLSPKPASHQYFEVSRRSLLSAVDFQSADPMMACSGTFSGTLAEFVSARFSYPDTVLKDIRKSLKGFLDTTIELPRDRQMVAHFLVALVPYTRDYVEEQARFIRKLAEQKWGGTIPLLVDLGYSGTIQKCLEIITQRKTFGLYLATTPSIDEGNHKLLYKSVLSPRHTSGHHGFFSVSLMVESLLSSGRPSVFRYVETGDELPIGGHGTSKRIDVEFGTERRSKRSLSLVESISAMALQLIDNDRSLGLEFGSAEQVEHLQVLGLETVLLIEELLGRGGLALEVPELDDEFSGVQLRNYQT